MPQLFFEGAAANAVLSETTMVPVLPSPRKRRTPRKRKSPRKRTPRKRRELAPLSGEVAEVLNWFEILVCLARILFVFFCARSRKARDEKAASRTDRNFRESTAVARNRRGPFSAPREASLCRSAPPEAPAPRTRAARVGEHYVNTAKARAVYGTKSRPSATPLLGRVERACRRAVSLALLPTGRRR